MLRRASVPIALLLVACAADPEDRASTAAVAGAGAEVQVFGSVHEVCAEGERDGAVDLDRWAGVNDLYGLGVLEGLAGEVAILAGVPIVSRADGAAVKTSRGEAAAGESAAFLAVARVPAWRRVTLDAPTTLAALEAELVARGKKLGLDPDRPFPFLVYGLAERVELHVVDGTKIPEGPSTPAAHRAGSIRQTHERAEVTLVGVHSPAATEGVLAHRGARSHIHALVPGDRDPRVVGHVDDLVLAPGATLALPLREVE